MAEIFTSRKFWAAIVGVVVMFLLTLFPSFTMDEELAIGFLIVIASYILGVAIDPGPGGWRGVLQSRKFWAAVIGFVLLVLNGFGIELPAALPADTLIYFAVLIGTYISGVALEAPARALLNR